MVFGFKKKTNKLSQKKELSDIESDCRLWFTSANFPPITIPMKFLAKLITDSKSIKSLWSRCNDAFFTLNQYSNDHRYIDLSQMI